MESKSENFQLTKEKSVFLSCRKLFFDAIDCEIDFLKVKIFLSWVNSDGLLVKDSFTPLNYTKNIKDKCNHELTKDFPNGWFDFGSLKQV